MTKILNKNTDAFALHEAREFFLVELAQNYLQAEVGKIQPAQEEPYFFCDIAHHDSANVWMKLIGGVSQYDTKQILNDAKAAMYTLGNNRL